MAGDVGQLHGKRRLEIAVEELVVASAHARRGDLQENLVRLGLGHGNLFDPKRLLVSVHSGCSHLHVIPSSSIDKKCNLPSRQTQTPRMLRMDQVHAYDTKVLVEGVSVRTVATRLGISCNRG